MRLYLLVLTIIVALSPAISQQDQPDSDAFDNWAYMEYANQHSPDNDWSAQTMFKLARSYQLNGSYGDAAYWYGRALEQEENPKWMLYYARNLQSLGDCENAVIWFKKYAVKEQLNDLAVQTFTMDCGAMRNHEDFGKVSFQLLEGINSGDLDFSPIPVDGGLIFTSNRDMVGPVKRTDKWSDKDFTDLYYAEKSGTHNFKSPVPLMGNTNTKFHNGAATINSENTEMYITANFEKGIEKGDKFLLKIVKATYQDGKWQVVEEFPYNDKKESNFHPTLSVDGRTMVFASTKKGSLGQTDLYYSNFENGNWTEPKNLGKEINSTGNELFPFLDAKGRLFFSTDGRSGKGGLDVFVCEKTGDNTWGIPQNLGDAFNSSKDDFGIFVFPDGKSGYLSSNRDGGLGQDDIYFWQSEPAYQVQENQEYATVRVIDESTGLPIGGARVNWIQTTNANGILGEGYWVSNEEGMVEIPVNEENEYVFNAMKEGYNPSKLKESGKDLLGKELEIPLKAAETILINGIVMDKNTGAYEGSFGFEVLDECTGAKATFSTDEFGNFSLEAHCGCTYRIKSLDPESTFTEKTWTPDCDNNRAQLLVERKEAATPSPYTNGEVITLNNLYYDFDRWNIREDAAIELDNVVQIMKEYPSMEVELASHTDSRGNDLYNMSLSQKRAESAVKYIVSQGIEKSRISARGYGESQLVNDCANGAQCTEEEHQDNRRTEIRIIRLDEKVKLIRG